MLGSAVNPVLREGNSDRRAAAAVKEYAKKHPHQLGKWTPDSKAHVATMSRGDFAANEKSVTVPEATTARIEFTDKSGKVTVLKDKLALKAGEVIDGTFMSRAALVSFLEAQMEDAKKQGVLFSLHLKATMMKVSDPIIFGFAVRTFFQDVFDKHAAAFKEVGVDPNNGLGDLYAAIKRLPAAKQAEIEADIQACLRQAARAGDGQLRQGDHQPARAERRDHRRLDPPDDPRLRADVGTGRQAPRGQGRHPRPQLRAALSRGHRALPAARRVRPEDDGHRAERRADGPAGRGVRLPRQDLPDPGRRHGARRRRSRARR